MIAVHQLSKTFNPEDGAVLDGLSFGLPAGETLAVIGPSGCGKTTLARLLARLDNPPAGTVSVGGVDLTAIAGQLGNNADVSAGLNEVGRREYTLRFSGKYDVESLGDLVLEWRSGRPILLRDVARVEMAMVEAPWSTCSTAARDFRPRTCSCTCSRASQPVTA